MEQCVETFGELGERRSLAEAHHTLGIVLQESGRHEEALLHANSALSMAKEQGDRFREGGSLYVIGLINYDKANYSLAESAFRDALQVLHGMAPLGEAATRVALGRLARIQNRFDVARALFADALPVLRNLNNVQATGLLLHQLGLLEQQTGSLTEAAQLQGEALRMFRVVDYTDGEQQALDALDALSR